MKELLRVYFIAARNALMSFNLMKLPLVFFPQKFLNSVQSEIFFFKTLSGKRRLIQKNFDEALSYPRGPLDIKIDLPNKWFISDCSYTKDIMTLCLICKIVNPKTIFEIGTLDGYTAYHFALNTSEETRICTLDLPREGELFPALGLTYMDKRHILSYRSTSQYLFKDTPEERKISCLFGDSFKFDFAPYHNHIDFFFIDGAHSYDYVRSDTINALQCVRKDGILAWHDYGRAGVNGVSKFLHELANDREIFSVPGSSVAFMVKKK